jgi:hypothetical protein
LTKIIKGCDLGKKKNSKLSHSCVPLSNEAIMSLLKFVKRLAHTIRRSALVSEDPTVGNLPTFGVKAMKYQIILVP